MASIPFDWDGWPVIILSKNIFITCFSVVVFFLLKLSGVYQALKHLSQQQHMVFKYIYSVKKIFCFFCLANDSHEMSMDPRLKILCFKPVLTAPDKALSSFEKY